MRREQIEHFTYDGGELGEGRTSPDATPHTRGAVVVEGHVAMVVDTYVFPVFSETSSWGAGGNVTLSVYSFSPEFLGLLREPLLRFARTEGRLGFERIGGQPLTPGMGVVVTEESGFSIHTPGVFQTPAGQKFTAEVVFLGHPASRRLMGWKYIADWGYVTQKEAISMVLHMHTIQMRTLNDFCAEYIDSLKTLSERKEIVEVHHLPDLTDWKQHHTVQSEFVTDSTRIAELFARDTPEPVLSGRGMLIDL